MHPDDSRSPPACCVWVRDRGGLRGEFPPQDPDGEIRWVTVRSVPIEANDGTGTGGASARWRTSASAGRTGGLRQSEEALTLRDRTMTEGLHPGRLGRLIESILRARRLSGRPRVNPRRRRRRADGSPLRQQFPEAINAEKPGAPCTTWWLCVHDRVEVAGG